MDIIHFNLTGVPICHARCLKSFLSMMLLWFIISLKSHDTFGQGTSKTATLDIFLPQEMFQLATCSDSKQ